MKEQKSVEQMEREVQMKLFENDLNTDYVKEHDTNIRRAQSETARRNCELVLNFIKTVDPLGKSPMRELYFQNKELLEKVFKTNLQILVENK